MTLDVDLEREQDIEELRRIAQARQAQNRAPARGAREEEPRDRASAWQAGDLQLALKMLETLQAKAKAAEEAVQRAEAEQKKRAAERERQRAEQPRKPGGLQTILLVIAVDPAPGAAPIRTVVIEKRGRA